VTDTLPSVDPRRTALLVMDYQAGILGRLDQAEALLACADYEAVPAHSRFAPLLAAAGPAMHSDSPATAVHDTVAPEPGDITVRKTRVGAFSTTDLDQQLRDRGIINLILAGISTSGVVLSTVRDAADRDYQVFVLADACADPVPGVHDFLTEKIFPRQAHVITSAELKDLLSGP
jgi:nicotinamidase-related amidase